MEVNAQLAHPAASIADVGNVIAHAIPPSAQNNFFVQSGSYNDVRDQLFGNSADWTVVVNPDQTVIRPLTIGWIAPSSDIATSTSGDPFLCWGFPSQIFAGMGCPMATAGSTSWNPMRRLAIPKFSDHALLLESLRSGLLYSGNSAARPSAKETPPRHPRISASNRIASLTHIQTAFGLPILQLALALGRSRTQVYRWLDPNESVEIHKISNERLRQLATLADIWLGLTQTPLASVASDPLPSGRTVLDMLSDENLDQPGIRRAFKILAATLGSRGPSLSQQLREKGFRRRARLLPDDQ
jgi:hypothetical protein